MRRRAKRVARSHRIRDALRAVSLSKIPFSRLRDGALRNPVCAYSWSRWFRWQILAGCRDGRASERTAVPCNHLRADPHCCKPPNPATKSVLEIQFLWKRLILNQRLMAINMNYFNHGQHCHIAGVSAG